MPIHDWTRVEDGTFHAFHHSWIEELHRALNRGILPDGYYAMPEQRAVGLIPDVLTLEVPIPRPNDDDAKLTGATATLVAPPRLRPVGEVTWTRPRRRPKSVRVRRSADHRLVAVIEVVSPGNKASRNPTHAFLRKAGEFLRGGIHLMILDLHPPGPFDPFGLHAAFWQLVSKTEYRPPTDKPLTFASYDAGAATARAFVEPTAVGDLLPELPLFLLPGLCVELPLEPSYMSAFEAVPRQRRGPLESAGGA